MSEIEVPNVLDLARKNYSAEDQAKAAEYLGVNPEDPSLLILLGVATQLGLNPFLGEINLLPEDDPRSADGAGKGVGKLKPAVGRDGLLKVARNTPGFLALRGNAVCENDSLEIIDDGDEVTIRHAFAVRDGKKATGDDDPSKWRGPVIGAWAKLIMEGRPSTFYYAPLHEHGPEDRDLQGDEYWRYLSTMALKAAQSYVLRIGIGVTGIIPIDEIREERALPAGQESMDAEILRVIHSEVEDIPKQLRVDLEEAVMRANEIEPGSWNPSKVRMRLVGRTVADCQAVLEEVRADVAKWETTAAATQLEESKPATSIVSIPAEEVTVGMILLGRDTEAPGRVVHHVHITQKMVTFMVHDEGSSPPPEGMEGAVGDTVKRKRDKKVTVRVGQIEEN